MSYLSHVEAFTKFFGRIENRPVTQAVRSGLVIAIPLLMVGSFALILRTLPIGSYQAFLLTPLGDYIADFLTLVHDAAFGILSLFMTVSISVSYARTFSREPVVSYGAPIAALASFAILSGGFAPLPAQGVFGVRGMFTALLCSTFATAVFVKAERLLSRRKKTYSDGADNFFNIAVAIILPLSLVAGGAAVIDALIVNLFQVSGFHELFVNFASAIFKHAGLSFLSGLLFVFLSSLLWFFGIHGSNVLEGAMNSLFTPQLEANMLSMSEGLKPAIILTKPFFDVFVLIGGCGTALALLISIILFSRRSSNRNLAKMSAFPMLFNINEIMVFGFPIVLNPLMFIPFILTPAVCYVTTYLAMYWGLVPVTISEVEWTTPALIGGYAATGSLRGSLLQLVNICLGIAIYRPFVRMYDAEKSRHSSRRLSDLVKLLQEHEHSMEPVRLTSLEDEKGAVAKMLAEDLEEAIRNRQFEIFYQPQYDNMRRCSGTEALLRWQHPAFGRIYPPLVIKLADEKGMLLELEKGIVEKVVSDLHEVKARLGEDVPVSVNVSGATIQLPQFEDFLKTLLRDGSVRPGELHLEITEQMALDASKATDDRLSRISAMGFPMEIDDFSMGNTSIKYLQGGQFETVKLDGEIVRNMLQNQRSLEIVASIVALSHSLHFKVIAEFVENEQIRRTLEDIGCTNYQGYLFSPAVPLKELKKL